MNADYDYCRALVRERDRERYLSALYAPAGKRHHLFALYAFDLELAHVPDAVREPMAGEIRFQWWREALAGERAAEAAANPVAAATLDTVERCALPAQLLSGVADARQFDLLDEPMQSMSQLFQYLDTTAGAIMTAAARVLNVASPASGAIRHAATAYGLTRLLRRFSWDISRGRVFVPLDLLASHEVHTASVLSGENTQALRNALHELRGIVRAELESARNVGVPSVLLPALLQVALTPIYLAAMEKADYDPFRTDVSVSALRAQFVLWRAARSGAI